MKFTCVTVTSKNPKALADFYTLIGAPVYVENGDYDGWRIGDPEKGGTVRVWDENIWKKPTAGFITVVLDCDDVDKTYADIISKGIKADPPQIADWGGKELTFYDPDGNIVKIL